jgi:PAS domain S-box-containing protein
MTLWRSVEVALRSRHRQYQVRDLLEVRSKLAAIVEFSDDAIISKDLNSVITSWNRGAEKLFGYTAQEAIGQPVTMLIPPDRIGEEPQILARVRRGRAIEHYETVRCRKDGTRLDISLTISPVRDERGKIIGVSKIARDISGRKRVEEDLRQAQMKLREHAASLEKTVADRTVELRAINEQLEAFVYSIAHDLRAPLRTMIAFPELLITEYAPGMNETANEMLRRIQRASQFMDKLLVDLLAYGRAARGEISLAPVSLQKVWKNALFQCAGEIEKRDAQIETVNPLPKVQAHETTLGQCLANLLGNALKFVPPESQPQIRFSAEERGGFVRLSVEDNGIGISADQHERIFNVFERVHGGRYPGTGIGLSIVRKGIERMGGKVGVQSVPEEGARFWIDLHPAS